MRAYGRGRGDNSGADQPPQPEANGLAAEDNALELSELWLESPADAPVPNGRAWLAPVLALLAIGGWSAFFVWAHQTPMLASVAPAQWATWLVQWSVPVALVGIVWLLAMRSSHAEAQRFAAVAALMKRESASLEARLKVVNRELSLAREFLAAEARDLEALGRIAAERISAHAGELQSLIVANGAQVEAIGTTSETALGNMNRLRDDLPVIANAARDVANQIGSAGRVAEEQLARLIGGFERLDAAGQTSEARVTEFSGSVAGALSGFESQLARIEALATRRFSELQSEADAYRSQIAELEDMALAALRERAGTAASETEAIAARLHAAGESAQERLAEAISALHDALTEKLQKVDELDRDTRVAALERVAQLREESALLEDQLIARNQRFDELIEQRQAAFETHEAQASEVLAQRLAALDDALAQRRDAQLTDAATLLSQGEAMTARLDELGAMMRRVGETGDAARTRLDAGLAALGEQLAQRRAALAETEAQLAEATDSAVRLLEIIQSGARSTREDLAYAIGHANEALAQVEGRAGAIEQLMLRSSEQGSDLSDYLLRTRGEIDAADVALASLRTRLGEDTDDALARLQGLRAGFARLAQESGAMAENAQDGLRAALDSLEAAITRAFATLEEGARERTVALAEGIGGQAVDVLERALRNEAASAIGKLEQAAAHASGVGREAAIQLRDQLAKVNELTGNLEQRVTRARELAEEQINNDFARRMALITDSLNSAAIDISSALSTEVADTAWDAYLKGDRGIFTRRAVRLIDNAMAKNIAALYGSDDTFRANVSRYIHDFEAMLRATLSTRDGHVLSVTMLGSDMGKLYVALAQAIQRLR